MDQARDTVFAHLQVQIDDHQIVAVVWRGMQDLLANNHLQSETFARQLFQLLPSLATVAPDDLPAIARIHLQSATHIGDTMKLIAPEAYTDIDSTCSADTGSTGGFSGTDLTGGLDVAASSPAAAAMLAKLIDLQIFHLVRAREAIAYMRAHAAARRRAEAVAAAAAAAAVTVAVDGGAQAEGHMAAAAAAATSSA